MRRWYIKSGASPRPRVVRTVGGGKLAELVVRIGLIKDTVDYSKVCHPRYSLDRRTLILHI